MTNKEPQYLQTAIIDKIDNIDWKMFQYLLQKGYVRYEDKILHNKRAHPGDIIIYIKDLYLTQFLVDTVYYGVFILHLLKMYHYEQSIEDGTDTTKKLQWIHSRDKSLLQTWLSDLTYSETSSLQTFLIGDKSYFWEILDDALMYYLNEGAIWSSNHYIDIKIVNCLCENPLSLEMLGGMVRDLDIHSSSFSQVCLHMNIPLTYYERTVWRYYNSCISIDTTGLGNINGGGDTEAVNSVINICSDFYHGALVNLLSIVLCLAQITKNKLQVASFSPSKQIKEVIDILYSELEKSKDKEILEIPKNSANYKLITSLIDLLQYKGVSLSAVCTGKNSKYLEGKNLEEIRDAVNPPYFIEDDFLCLAPRLIEEDFLEQMQKRESTYYAADEWVISNTSLTVQVRDVSIKVRFADLDMQFFKREFPRAYRQLSGNTIVNKPKLPKKKCLLLSKDHYRVQTNPVFLCTETSGEVISIPTVMAEWLCNLLKCKEFSYSIEPPTVPALPIL